MYDVLTGYLASRYGKAAYYIPERLARYRVHSSSSTAYSQSENLTRALEWNTSLIFYYNQLLADINFKKYRKEIKNIVLLPTVCLEIHISSMVKERKHGGA
jgi:hypothetical protein